MTAWLRPARVLRGSYAVVLLVAAACSKSSTGPTGGGGSLTVTVTGATGGAAPSVVVSGPNGYNHQLSASATLTNLQTGSYSIAAAPVVSTNSVVNTVYAAAISTNPAEVTSTISGSTQVTYAARSGTGAVWIVGGTNASGNILNWATAYTAPQLAASSSVTPAVTLGFPFTLGGNIDASGVAFDTAGNLWVVNDNSNTVVAYTPAQLASTSNPSPALTLSGPAIVAPYALAFDASGNLWVANINVGTIVEFSPSQLLSSGTPTPVVTISEGNTSGPAGVAFDASGNLWVAHNLANTVGEYTKSQLANGGTISPSVTISGAALNFPQGIAFDVHGNLWVANNAARNLKGTIVEYAPSLLTASGSPTPTQTLIPPDNAGPVITALAFDNSANLWYIDLDNASIGEYTAPQLAAGGNPPPSVVISGAIAGVGIAFDPHSGTLPLH
jgi:sugar lactone lactonase YvrE